MIRNSSSPLKLVLSTAALFACGTLPVRAQTTTETFSYSPNVAIPDNSTVGASDTEAVSSSIATIIDVQVSVHISGDASAFNGDYYAYVTNGTGFSVLLNREGRTASNDFGYADNGFNVSFADTASNGDIHAYQTVLNPAGAELTGTWQPDGRNVNPSASLDTTARTAMLSSFVGQNPNGNWTLFVADASAGGLGALTGWSLQVTGAAVPEPGICAITLLGCAGLLMRRRRG